MQREPSYEELAEKARALEQEVERLRQADAHDLLTNLARLVPGVIYQYRLNPDGSSCFPYSSPGMVDIYEVTPEEVREDATPVFGRLHPDDANEVAELIFESVRTVLPDGIRFVHKPFSRRELATQVRRTLDDED